MTGSEVPQGSNLGQFLFVIFIDEVSNVISSRKFIFVDDLKFFIAFESVSDSYSLQADIRRLFAWSTENELLKNINKCKILITLY